MPPPVRRPPPHGDFLDRRLALCPTDTVLDWVVGTCATPRRQAQVVTYLNAHTANLGARDPRLAEIQGQSAVCYADGAAVVRAARRWGLAVPERINAGDFTTRVLFACAAHGIRLGLLGGVPAAVESFAERAVRTVPALSIPFVRDGFFDPAEGASIAARASAAGVDLLLVGMGSPRQEYWAWEHRGSTGAGVHWCVGALFEYGTLRHRAPVWVRRAGLEWAFRLALEPRRLAGRYLVGNAEFLVRSRRGLRP